MGIKHLLASAIKSTRTWNKSAVQMKSSQNLDEVAAAVKVDLILTENASFRLHPRSGLHHVSDFILKLVLGLHFKECSMRENKLADLSMLFSVNALELTNLIEGH